MAIPQPSGFVPASEYTPIELNEVANLEQRIRDQDALLDQYLEHILKLESELESKKKKSKPEESNHKKPAEKPCFTEEDYLRNLEIIAKLKSERKEIDSRVAEKDKKIIGLQNEIKTLQEADELLFPVLKSFCENLGAIIEHQALDSDSRETARKLLQRPDSLEHYIVHKKISANRAIKEITPLILEAKNRLSRRKKPGSAEHSNEHRAKILLERLLLVGEEQIRTKRAIEIIYSDEGVRPDKTVARRAMRLAAEMEPDKVDFSSSFSGGIGAVLKKRRCLTDE